MCRPQCWLAFFVLLLDIVHSWDIAVTAGDLKFYTNKTETHKELKQFRGLQELAYDTVNNMLLFVDKQNDNASIFSFSLALNNSKEQPLVKKRPNENIQGIAFDPITSILFWTDSSERSIYWISLKDTTKNDPYGNLFMKMDDEVPRAIAVDSCRGYLYWTNTNIKQPTIERARFDMTERKVIANTRIYMPVSIAIDQHDQKLYWVDDDEGIYYSIQRSDLDGNNTTPLYSGIHGKPNALTITKDAIYWIDLALNRVLRLPKNASKDTEPEVYAKFDKDANLYGIAGNYHLADQTDGVPECDILRNLSQNQASVEYSFSVPPNEGLFCVHGRKVEDKLECICNSGYTGGRCDTSVCQNFCFQGDCLTTANGDPSCSCKDGFTGRRCEINLCHGYCLNDGECSFTTEGKLPECSCPAQYEGTRCETLKIEPTTTTMVVPVTCNCTQNETRTSMLFATEKPNSTDGEFVAPISCNDGWDSVRDPVIMVLGIMCGILCLACAVLITKILHLKKRPRIKKRIIVNKNVTPMTARPDQCEITIENCCNMNICETPCFEPRSTIRPTLLESKPGKEEKKNLIANMEYPDDY